MSISITNNNFGNSDMWEYLSTLESIIRQSEEDLVRLEEQEPKDIGNFLFTSTKEGRDSCNDWIALHEGFFTAACRRWAKSLAPAGYDLDDLRQEARIIVFKAWRHYKTDRVDVLPTTFFWKCVESCKQKSSPKMKNFEGEEKEYKKPSLQRGKFCRPRKM